MQAFLSKGMITHPNEIDESDDYYSDNEEEPNNDPENDEEVDDEDEAEFDYQEEAADHVDEMLQKKTSLHRHHKSTHSTTGWTTGETFKDYLAFLSEYFQHQPIHLILDIFSVHRSPEIKEYARQLGITLHYIPAGCTDKYQPLDRRVFGALKATARHVFYAQYRENPKFQFSKQNAIEGLVYAWEHLSIDVIEDAWSIYVD